VRKRAPALAIVLASAAPWSALAENSGNDLLTLCTPESAICQGYVMGVYEVLSTDRVIASRRICPSPIITAGEVMDITIQFLEGHPELLHSTAVSLVSRALIEAFPCHQTHASRQHVRSELAVRPRGCVEGRHQRLRPKFGRRYCGGKTHRC
jgi:Rap1a immunity proteins